MTSSAGLRRDGHHADASESEAGARSMQPNPKPSASAAGLAAAPADNLPPPPVTPLRPRQPPAPKSASATQESAKAATPRPIQPDRGGSDDPADDSITATAPRVPASHAALPPLGPVEIRTL